MAAEICGRGVERAPGKMTELISKAQFERCLHTRFVLCDEEEEHSLELVELTSSNYSPKYESFSLIFRGNKERIHPQRTYPIKHGVLGNFDLFITAVGRTEEGTMYQAVFNRAVEK